MDTGIGYFQDVTIAVKPLSERATQSELTARPNSFCETSTDVPDGIPTCVLILTVSGVILYN